MAVVFDALQKLEIPQELRAALGIKPGKSTNLSEEFLEMVLRLLEQNKEALDELKKY